MNILLATFHTPGIRAVEHLIQSGYRPQQIHVLTHDMDKNHFLIEFLRGQGIETQTYPVRSKQALEWVRAFQPDALFSLYFRTIVPQAILDLPPLGCINLHPALLPMYRGTFSAPWAILNGETVTGFTYHRMLSQVDAGKIILQRQVKILPGDTAYSLYHRLLVEGMNAFKEAFHLVTAEQYEGMPQAGASSYYPRQVPFGGYIDPSWTRLQIDRFIRAMYFPPFKGALVCLADGTAREVTTMQDYDAICARENPVPYFPQPVSDEVFK